MVDGRDGDGDMTAQTDAHASTQTGRDRLAWLPACHFEALMSEGKVIVSLECFDCWRWRH